MPRISYYPVEQLEDPELCGYLDYATRYGTPRPESQAVRANVPAVLRSLSRNWEVAFRGALLDHAVKELCRVPALAHRTGAGGDRGPRRGAAGVRALRPLRRARKAALAYASALAWAPREIDDALWSRLRAHSDEQILELGYFVGLTFGQQRWIKTLQLGHGEVLTRSRAGPAEHAVVR
jgi:alkylhydroperoxidase family enzyme